MSFQNACVVMLSRHWHTLFRIRAKHIILDHVSWNLYCVGKALPGWRRSVPRTREPWEGRSISEKGNILISRFSGLWPKGCFLEGGMLGKADFNIWNLFVWVNIKSRDTDFCYPLINCLFN